MTSDAILIVGTIFHSIWSLAMSFDIPGTHMTPAEWAFFVMTVFVVVRFVKRVFGDVFGLYASDSDDGK